MYRGEVYIHTGHVPKPQHYYFWQKILFGANIMQKNNIQRFLYHIYYIWHIRNCSISFCYCGNKNAFTKNHQMWQRKVSAPVPRIHIDILVTSSFKHKRHLHSVRVWQHFKWMPWDTHTAAWVYRCILVIVLKLVYTHGGGNMAHEQCVSSYTATPRRGCTNGYQSCQCGHFVDHFLRSLDATVCCVQRTQYLRGHREVIRG